MFKCLILIGILGHLAYGNGIDEKIYHGTNAVRGQFPYIARTILAHPMSNITHEYIVCGGSLINDRWVVSAGHCAVGAISLTVILGMVDSSNFDGTISYNVEKSGIFIHPDYDPTHSPSPDVVLYKLPSSVPFQDYSYIRSIKVGDLPPNSVEKFDDSLVTIAGWGATSDSGDSLPILQYSTVKVFKNTECIEKYPPGATDATICTEKRYFNSGPCPGDSGGPLVTNQTDGGEIQIIGATSFGVGAPPCSDPNGVSVYTYLPYYAKWIYTTIQNN